MDALSAETETAFLIEKTNHQSFVSVLVGVVLTGETSGPCLAVPPVIITGIIYTALLLLKPADATCTQSSRMEEVREPVKVEVL